VCGDGGGRYGAQYSQLTSCVPMIKTGCDDNGNCKNIISSHDYSSGHYYLADVIIRGFANKG